MTDSNSSTSTTANTLSPTHSSSPHPSKEDQQSIGSPTATDGGSLSNREEEKIPQDNPHQVDSIRLTKMGGSYVAQVRLNNQEDVHLIVDTGATMTVLSYDVATDLGLLSGDNNSVSTVNTAGGSVQVSMAHLDHVQVGNAEAQNVEVAIHDLPNGIPGVSGLLGMSFLKHFLVTLDTEHSSLHLQSRN